MSASSSDLERLLANPQAREGLRRLTTDARFHNETLLKIVYKGRLIPWRYNLPQELVWRARRAQEEAGRPVRLVILKARREGISTLIEGWLYHKVSTQPHRTGMVVSHELDSANEIHEINRRFYDNAGLDGVPFRPSTPTGAAPRGRELVFDKLGSKLKVETANDVTAGRSMTVDVLHLSEVAFWRDASTLMLGLLQCVNDDDPETMVVVESTANGEGGWFYDTVIGAINGDNDFALVFLPWFIDERYQMAVPAGTNWTQDEEDIRRKYQWQGKAVTLTNEQLFWRRHVIRNKCSGDSMLFQQEYPGSVEEAFIATGRKRFERRGIDAMTSRMRKPRFRGYLRKEGANGATRFKQEKHENGPLRIYEEPIKGEAYVIFADVAEGKIVDTGGRDPDYSTIGVMRCKTMEEVAVWHGRCAPERLADEFEAMGYFYNEAYGTPEKNSKGYATLAALKERGYPNLHAKQIYDKMNQLVTKEFGWETTGKSKPMMIDDLARALNDGDLQSHHPRTHEELRRFAVLDDGSLGAPPGLHDDCVIRLAGLVQMRKCWYSDPDEDRERRPSILQDEEDFEEEDGEDDD